LKRSQIKSSIHPAGSFNPGGGWGGGGQLEQASQRHCDSFPRSTGMLIYSTLVFETLCHSNSAFITLTLGSAPAILFAKAVLIAGSLSSLDTCKKDRHFETIIGQWQTGIVRAF
jgi:hypothetical protein